METAIIVMWFIMCLIITGMSVILAAEMIKDIIDDWREGR